jgi:predicted dehydrogenase
MSTTLDGIGKVLEAAARSGKRYMLMETENYSRTFLYAKRLYQEGTLGKMQFATGVHYQNMEGWPDYWRGLPPMYYSSHGLGPILELSGHAVASVSAAGSGTLPESEWGFYDNRFPVEAALFTLSRSDVTLQMTCCLYQMARIWAVDRFSVYGDLAGLESSQLPGGPPVLHRVDPGPLEPGLRGRPVTAEPVDVPPLADLVGEEIREFVASSRVTRGIPLVHEFVSSIIEHRESNLGPRFAANLTAAGICAHLSAATRKPVEVPTWE